MRKANARHLLWWAAWGTVAAIYVLSLNYYVQGADDATYLVLSRALATGAGFVRIDMPGMPPETHFLPGFPFLMMPVWWLPLSFPANLPFLKMVGVVLGLTSLVVLAKAVDFSLHTVSWRWVLLLAGLAPFLIHFASQTAMSEVPYLFISALALQCAAKIEQQPSGIRWGVILGVVLAAAYYVRIIGLVLAIGVLGYLVFRRRFRAVMVACLLLIILLAPWAVRNTLLGHPVIVQDYGMDFWLRDYARPELGTIGGLAELPGRMVHNLLGHVTQSIPEILFGSLAFGAAGRILGAAQPAAMTVVGSICSALILSGFWIAIRRRGVSALECYLPLYLGVVLLPPWVVTRNLVPIIPFLLGYLFVGIEGFAQWLNRRWHSPILIPGLPVVAVVILFLLFLLADRHGALSGWWRGRTDPLQQSLETAGEWIRAYTPVSARLAGEFAPRWYLYTDRQTVPVYRHLTSQEFLEDLRNHGISFLVMQPGRQYGGAYDSGEPAILGEVVNDFPESFEQVYRSRIEPEVFVYRLR